MFESVLKNRDVLQQMQDNTNHDAQQLSSELHLNADDLGRLQNIVTILSPAREMTKALSASISWVGDELPLLTSTIDAVQRLDTTFDAEPLRT